MKITNAMQRWRLVAVMVLVCSINGCSGPSYSADSEDALKTQGYFHQLDHISAYYPGAISLNFHGYVVSIEEASRKRVTSDHADILLSAVGKQFILSPTREHAIGRLQ